MDEDKLSKWNCLLLSIFIIAIVGCLLYFLGGLIWFWLIKPAIENPKALLIVGGVLLYLILLAGAARKP